MILKYDKNLRYILSEFQPSLQILFPEFNCKSGAVEKTLSSIFSSDGLFLIFFLLFLYIVCLKHLFT